MHLHDRIQSLTPIERKDRIKQSLLASQLKFLRTQSGMEFFLNSDDWTQDEKDYILFRINDLDALSKMKIHKFREAVLKFKEELAGEDSNEKI